MSNSTAITRRFNFPTCRRKCCISSLGGRETLSALYEGVCSLKESHMYFPQNTIHVNTYVGKCKYLYLACLTICVSEEYGTQDLEDIDSFVSAVYNVCSSSFSPGK